MSVFSLPNDRIRISSSSVPNAGRGVFVNQDVSAGEELYRTVPMVLTVEDGEEERICDWCHCSADPDQYRGMLGSLLPNVEVPSLKVCDRCRHVKYCSINCQRAAWNAYHQHECKIFQAQRDHKRLLLDTSPSWRILARLLSMLKLGSISDRDFKAVCALRGPPEGRTCGCEACMVNRQLSDGCECDNCCGSSTLSCASYIKELAQSELTERDLLNLQIIIKNNILKGSGNASFTICQGIDITTCHFNHSCSPNAFFFIEGRELRVRTLRRIKRDEEVFIYYLPPQSYSIASLHARRENLSHDHAFDCECPRCTSESQLQATLSEADKARKMKLIEAQMEIRHLLNHFSEGDINKNVLQSKTQTVMRKIYPGDDWPEQLDPAPEIAMMLTADSEGAIAPSEIFKAQVRQVYKLKGNAPGTGSYHLKVFALLRFVKLLEGFFHHITLSTPYGQTCPLDLGEYDLFYEGVLFILTRAVEWLFGRDVAFLTRIRQKMHEWRTSRGSVHLECDFTNKKFRGKWKKWQAALMEWSKVSKELAFMWKDEHS